MLVLDKSRAINEMLWLAQRNHNAVPEAFQRPSGPAWALAEDGRRVLTAAVILRPQSAAPVEVMPAEPEVAPVPSSAPSMNPPAHREPMRLSPRFRFATKAA